MFFGESNAERTVEGWSEKKTGDRKLALEVYANVPSIFVVDFIILFKSFPC